MQTRKVQITVLKKTFDRRLVEAHTEGVEWKPCDRVSEGQEFISEGEMPLGFCSWAWCDIQKYVMVLACGGNMVGVKPGRFVTCCTDGFRPVFFELERIEERN